MTAIPINVPASVNLGSSSFRLQVCENHNGQLKIVDSFRQMVRFAAGLDEQKNLSEGSQEHALECLAKFGERLCNFQPEQARVMATNTFRVAKSIGRFIPKAEAALESPIEVTAGRKETCLIHAGTVHTLSPNGDRMLVIDIDDDSTESVIGSDLWPTHTENLPLSCVTYSVCFFQSKIGNKDFQAAIAAARNEIQRISKLIKCAGWDFAIDTSGSVKSTCDVLAAEYLREADITYEGMRKLVGHVATADSVKKTKFENLKPEHAEVFTGGLTAVMAAFEELGTRKMAITETALRDGVFYDPIGRSLDEDMHEQTTAEFQHHYHVSLNQANRIANTAQKFMESLCHEHNVPVQSLTLRKQHLSWAGRLREIRLDTSYTDYRKHSAYILENVDMPGLSRKGQSMLTQLVPERRDGVRRMIEIVGSNETMWCAILSLCLVTLFYHAWMPLEPPPFTQLRPDNTGKGFTLHISRNWLEQYPPIGGALAYENT